MSSRRKGNSSRVVGIVVLGMLTAASYAGWRVLKPQPVKGGPDTSLVANLDSNPDSSEPQRSVATAEHDSTSPGTASVPQESDPKPVPAGTPILTMGEGTNARPKPAVTETRRSDPPTTNRPAQNTSTPTNKPVPLVETETLTESVKQLVSLAETKRTDGDQVGARELYLRALYHRDATESDRNELRPQITALNDEILFSPTLYPKEPMTRLHAIVQGDYISKLPRRQNLAIDQALLARVNRMSDPNKIRLGQKVKLITGPFHAEVVKSAFRMDIYSGPRDDPKRWRYIRSFSVGIGDTGQNQGTPVGEFVVSKSKVTNPSWANPSTGERFEPDDPNNPIGEFWIGLNGIGNSAAHNGYGIHGTVDPDSIGNSRSMGCVRLHDVDIAFVYELLVPEKSRVRILP